jgi:hypothetical protein
MWGGSGALREQRRLAYYDRHEYRGQVVGYIFAISEHARHLDGATRKKQKESKDESLPIAPGQRRMEGETAATVK